MPRLWYCDHHTIPLPEGHRFPTPKYHMVRAMFAAEGEFELTPAPFAELTDIERAHDPDYVRAFLSGALPAAAQRRIGFPWSEGLVRRTLASLGGTLAAADDALTFGWGGNMAGGTHHAMYAEGAGYCVFNDFAVAIRKLQSQGRIRRAATIDLDVHQGDGTAQILAGDTDVFTLSIHCRNNFPFRKQQSTLDVELDAHSGDEDYLATLDQALPRAFDFRPEIVFYQSGVDGLASDTLGRLSLTPEGLIERDRRVFQMAIAHDVPLVITLGGGYSNPIELTAKSHANTYRTAAEVYARRGVAV